jgi:hypothetical protein
LDFSQRQIAEFLAVSVSLVNRCEAQTEEAKIAEARREVGRPAFLNVESEQIIRDWLQRRAQSRNWPTLREAKEQIVAELERTGNDATPSKSYSTHCLERILGDKCIIRPAQPIAEDRYNVKMADIRQHFANFGELEISDISPELIIKLDETGFGASKSGRQKSRRVIVPESFSQTPVFKESSDSHFVTALCGISASGNVLTPGLIAKRETDHPDADQCSFLPNVRRYASVNPFVTWQIFIDYLRSVLTPYIAHWRQSLCGDARALLIFDGHRAHLSEILNAWAAEHQILLYLLPAHSSHLLQPLDQGFFRRLKIQYSLFPPIKGLSKISSSLERIWMAIQATTIARLVWNAWTHTGIACTIRNGECRECTLQPEHVLRDPTLQGSPDGAAPIFEGGRGRGVGTSQFGLLNEDEMLIWEAGQCPFCCQPLEH